MFIKGCKSWCKGLTKETDDRVAKRGINISKSRKGQPSPFKGKKCPQFSHKPWNEGLTKETDERVAATARKISVSRAGKKSNWSPEGSQRRSKAISLSKLGKPHPLTEKTINKRLKEKEEKFGFSRNDLEQLYLIDILTIKEISELIRIPENNVYDLLCRYNIPRRTHRETMNLRPDLYENWYNNTAKAASITLKELHNDPSFLLKIVMGIHRKPNKLELQFEEMLLKNNLPYKYVGDGQVIIGYWCPDYINTNNEKKLIELFGDYFHRGENPQNRINKFAKYGFETLVIWEHELKDDPATVIDKVIKFDEGLIEVKKTD